MNDFLSQGTPQSSTRLIALLLTLGIIGFAFAYPKESMTLGVLVGALLTVMGAKVVKDIKAPEGQP